MSNQRFLQGNLELTTVDADGVIDDSGWTDVGEDIAQFIVRQARDSVTRNQTMTRNKETRSGALEYMLVIQFYNDPSAAGEVHDMIWTAVEGGLDMAFRGSLQSGAISATNKGYSGVFAPVALDTGGTLGEWLQQTQTYPARDVERTSTPWPVGS